jgi:hypothetical protein
MVNTTIPILFNGGSYGTYLEWALTTLTTDVEIAAPFTILGSSHKFKGNHLNNIDGWDTYVKGINPVKFVRFHPKTSKNESIIDNLDCIFNSVNKVIYLYPDSKSKLLVINNWFTKLWKNWWLHQFGKEIDPMLIYNNWPVSHNSNLDDLPPWIKREFLSLYLMPAWHDQVEWYNPAILQNYNNNCLIISVTNLLYNLEYTLKNIQNFFNLTYIKSISEIMPLHATMLSLQSHLGQDIICNQIINNTLEGSNFDWQPLPLVSEGWIQWQLRNLKYEIKCNELDIFPTNSIQLKKLLYKT